MRLFFIALLLISSFNFSLAENPPRRIVSCMPSITEMLYALGLEEEVVGVTSNCNYPPEAQKKEKVGGFFLNLEKIAALKPDLVIMLEDAQKKEISRFRGYGLPVFAIKTNSIEEMMGELLRLGKVVGREEKAQEIVNGLKGSLEAVDNRLNPPKFNLLQVLRGNLEKERRKALVLVGYNPVIVAGKGTFIDSILRHAGVENFAEGMKAAYPQMSFEKIVYGNPEYLIILKRAIPAGEITKDSRWQSLRAFKENKVLIIDDDIISRPAPRAIEAVEEINRFVYPQLL